MEEILGLTATTDIVVKVKSPFQKVSWFLIGDAHIGNCSFDREAFKNLQKNILRQANISPVIITFMGDMLESIIVGDARYSPKEQEALTKSQIEFFEWLAPLLKNKNITFNGYLCGNHEIELIKKGIDSVLQTEHYTKKKVKQYGSMTHNVITLQHGKKTKKLRSVLCHASRKSVTSFKDFARRCWYQLNDKNELVRVRIVASGHTHDLYHETEIIDIPQPEKSHIPRDILHLCRTGSFLKQDYNSPNYAIDSGYLGKPVGYIEVQFSMEISKNEGDPINVFKRCIGDINQKMIFKLRDEI